MSTLSVKLLATWCHLMHDTMYYFSQKARAKYRRIMTDYSHKLKDLSRQLGTCVSKSRPYFDSVQKAKKVSETSEILICLQLL